jgi:hypothetical protein
MLGDKADLVPLSSNNSPWLFAICGLCFAEDTFINH